MIASHPVQAMSNFYLPWLAAAATAVAQQPDPASGLVLLHLGGAELPIVQIVLAIAGVLMARPLAPRGVPPLSRGKSLLVTAIMMIVAGAWAFEDRPSVLFTFVVSIGLGFSGYSLIELAGAELLDTVRTFFAALKARISNIMGPGQ